jgi:hypothetical protein
VSPSTDCLQCHAAQPTADRPLCTTCTAHLHTWLVELAGHASDLETVVVASLTSRRGERVMVRCSSEAPQQWNENASTALEELRSDLWAMVRELVDEGVTYNGVDKCSAMAAWLAKRVERIALDPAALENFDIVRHRHGETVKAVDIAPAKVWLGRCDAVVDGAVCGQDVRCDPGQRHVRCVCMTVHNVAEFRVRVLVKMRGYLGTAAELAAMLPAFIGKPLTRKRITYYGELGLIRRIDRWDDVVYQLGEVVDAHDSFVDKRGKGRAAA